MAQFKNVSGLDRDLSLAEWYGPRSVEAGGLLDVDDALADRYPSLWDSPEVWEPQGPAPVAASEDEG